MNRWLLLSLVFAVAGCYPGGVRIIDGGRVDRDGWPVRALDATPYRCPIGTQLIDQIAESGRRVVTCQKNDNPVPRGFQLTWNDAGRMVARLILSPEGAPIERVQWFDNGRKAGEETYVDGKLVRRVAWYENGQKRADQAYDADKDLMLVERYQADGSIEAAGQSREGRRVGVWREWRDGALEEVEFVDGVEHGPTVRAYPNGGVEKGQYEGGRKVGTWVRFDARGNPVREAQWMANELQGTLRSYHPNGQLREEGEMLQGHKHGRWRAWFPSGELETDQYYVCGVLWGPSKAYYPSGKLHTAGSFERGRKVGEWKIYSETGIETHIDTHALVSQPFDPAQLPRQCAAPEQERSTEL